MCCKLFKLLCDVFFLSRHVIIIDIIVHGANTFVGHYLDAPCSRIIKPKNYNRVMYSVVFRGMFRCMVLESIECTLLFRGRTFFVKEKESVFCNKRSSSVS